MVSVCLPYDALSQHLPSYLGFSYLGVGFPGGSEVKASAWNVGDLGSTPGLGRYPGEVNSYPFPYSCLEPDRLQSMDHKESDTTA